MALILAETEIIENFNLYLLYGNTAVTRLFIDFPISFSDSLHIGYPFLFNWTVNCIDFDHFSSLRKCAVISARYGLSEVFDNLVISLCKFTTLLSQGEVCTLLILGTDIFSQAIEQANVKFIES